MAESMPDLAMAEASPDTEPAETSSAEAAAAFLEKDADEAEAAADAAADAAAKAQDEAAADEVRQRLVVEVAAGRHEAAAVRVQQEAADRHVRRLQRGPGARRAPRRARASRCLLILPFDGSHTAGAGRRCGANP